MPNFDKKEMKDLFKQALKEWMDEKFIQFGKWSAYTIAALALSSLMYFVLWINGFKK